MNHQKWRNIIYNTKSKKIYFFFEIFHEQSRKMKRNVNSVNIFFNDDDLNLMKNPF